MKHADLMEQLANKHNFLVQLIDNSRIHYVDMPVYGNIGDMLIMFGALGFFEKHKLNVTTKSAYFNFNPEWVQKKDVIVLNGGGNFGDLYKGPQNIRQRIVEELPHNRIIVLPQTIHFTSTSKYEECCNIFSKHQDLHICIRDQKSFNLATKMSRNVYLAPDMAHQLWPMILSRKASPLTLGLVRSDDESTGRHGLNFDRQVDWPKLIGYHNSLIKQAYRIMRALHLLKIDRHIVNYEMFLWEGYAKILVNKAINLFSGYEHIITDRLHGHILACLLNIPHTVLDNSYGKNHTYVSAWTVNSDIVSTVPANNSLAKR